MEKGWALAPPPAWPGRGAPAGQLSLRGSSLLAGYLSEVDGKPRFTDPKRDGWFCTEDLGDVAGRQLVLRGRDCDFVKIGGESVSVAALAQRLQGLHLAMLAEDHHRARRESSAGHAPAEMALFAESDERLGAHIALAVTQAMSAHEVNRLRREFDARSAPFERIRAVYVLPSLPRTALGKLETAKLIALVQGQAPSVRT